MSSEIVKAVLESGDAKSGGLSQVIKGYQKFSATPKYMVYN